MRIQILILSVFLSLTVLSQTHNTVQNWVAQKPMSSESQVIDPVRTPFEVIHSTQFMDGFGRPLQVVSKKTSPLQQDAVSMYEYDTWGRQPKQYLPFVSGNNGAFKTSPLTLQTSFNQSLFPGESGFYAETNFENTPSGRVTKSMSPGSSWVGSSRGVAAGYLVNTTTDAVRVWNIALAAGSLPSSTVTYAAGQLQKSIIVDERNLQLIEYKNKDGQTILKKVQLSATADNGTGSNHAGWLCTYYVYDDYGNMRFLITPKVVDLIDGPWTISQTIADELCYRYEYDDFGRVIISKNPGTAAGIAGEEWMVYDQRGRLVMRQDGNQRAIQKWEYYQYDNLDRIVRTGLLQDPSNYLNRTYHQDLAKNRAVAPPYPDVSSYTHELLTETYYDNYAWTSAAGVPSALDQTNISNTNIFHTPSDLSFPYPQAIRQTAMTRGFITGSKTGVLGSNGSQYLYAVTFYDDEGRIIQTHNTNPAGTDKVTMQYGWVGMTLRTYYEQNRTTGTAQNHAVITKLNYGHLGRLQSVSKKINSTIQTLPSATVVNGDEKIIATYTYNELGQVTNKKIGLNPVTNVELESLNYDYNVRGWTTGINKDFTQSGNTGNYFGEQVGFDKTATMNGTTFANSNYVGSATGILWKSKSDGVPRKYDFVYDNVHQLTAANYLQLSGSSGWDKTYMDFSVNSMSYDLNGNIQTLNQNGFVLGGTPNIDNLNYNYQDGGKSNKLLNVIDNANNPNSKLGDFHYAGSKTSLSVDYTYDANGNKTSDINKNIVSIVYNELNLPSVITFTGNKVITFSYDAAGNKLNKKVSETGVSFPFNGSSHLTDIETITSYINGGYVYLTKNFSNPALASLNIQDALQFISQEEGRARIVYPLYGQAPYYAYDYFIRDRLGNIRVTLTDEVQQDTYPAATLESGATGAEQAFYNIVDDAAHIIPTSSLAWWSSVANNSYENNNGLPVPPDPTINPTSTSNNLYKLNGSSGDRFGMGIALKVMAGDVVNIFGKSVWHNNAGTTDNTSYGITNLLSSFINAFAGTGAVVNGTKGVVTGGVLNGNTYTTSTLTDILDDTPTPAGQTPKAYINWILFDEQFKPVQSGGGFDPVSVTADIIKNHSLTGIDIIASGYLYVYCSNESNQDVYFDNFQVVHQRGALIEEKHFYPGGLAMYALSSRAYGKLQVNFGYQGKELQYGEFYDGSGLEEYDFAARYYDPQLGRWWAQDPANQFASPYNAMGNSWPNTIDPTGTWALWDDIIVAGIGFLTGYISSGIMTGNWGWKSVQSGLVSAGMFMLGYYTGGASSAGSVAGAFSSGGFQAQANTVGLAYAGKAALSSAMGAVMPGISIPIGDFSIGISAGLIMSGGTLGTGMNISAGYDDGNFSIAAGFGQSGSSSSWGGSVKYKGFGASYARNTFTGDHPQVTATVGLYGFGGSLRVDEDYLGDGLDRWRTGGLEIGYRDFVFGLSVYTNDGEKESNGATVDKASPLWGGNKTGKEAWTNGQVFSSPVWIGYKNGNQMRKVGFSHKAVQDVFQNGLHQSWFPTPYYLNYDNFKGGIYSKWGYYNPYTLY